MKVALTDAAVRRLKSPEHGQLEVFDTGFPGLALRLAHGGSRSWTMVYRHGGKLKRITLGKYPQVSLKDARESWRKAREALEAGKDPKPLIVVRSPDSFASVAKLWLERDQKGKRTTKEAKRIIEVYCKPLHDQQLADISRRDVRDVIRAVEAKGVTMARRVHGRLQRLFAWAVEEDMLDTSPMLGLKKPGQEVKRDRVLTDDELRTLWNACDEVGWPFGPAVKLLVLTGCRREEIGGLLWSEVKGDTLELSASRRKGGEPHTVPLSSVAQAVMQELIETAPSPYVFTTSGRTAISGWSNAKRQLDAIVKFQKPFVVHDLRRTVATGLQRLGVPLQVTEAVLGHISGSRAGVVGIYQRYGYATEKREALEAWGAYVTSVVEGRV
jgi:integrase